MIAFGNVGALLVESEKALYATRMATGRAGATTGWDSEIINAAEMAVSYVRDEDVEDLVEARFYHAAASDLHQRAIDELRELIADESEYAIETVQRAQETIRARHAYAQALHLYVFELLNAYTGGR